MWCSARRKKRRQNRSLFQIKSTSLEDDGLTGGRTDGQINDIAVGACDLLADLFSSIRLVVALHWLYAVRFVCDDNRRLLPKSCDPDYV